MMIGGRIAIVAVVVGALAGGASARDRTDAQAPPLGTAQEAKVVAVVLDPTTQTPVVVLEGKRDHRTLTMAIGLAEATGIAIPLQGVTPPRPLTHDLFLTMFGRLKVSLSRVVIHDFRDNTYFATVHLAADGTPMTLDSRPSDAIALAIRAKVPVFIEDRVFERGTKPPPPTTDPKKPSI
ncbi:MAG: bifunctional nuclease family protein [Candidatus Rokubacteria bacterium]|nr:bifunctional nuclease family protein [Candidatus Rokubacteria bacterium]